LSKLAAPFETAPEGGALGAGNIVRHRTGGLGLGLEQSRPFAGACACPFVGMTTNSFAEAGWKGSKGGLGRAGLRGKSLRVVVIIRLSAAGLLLETWSGAGLRI